jgi:hypothetical protein
MRRGVLQSWLLRVTRARVVNAWRLLLVVLTVAVLAATTVTSVGLLVVATEQGAVRAALTSIPIDETTLDVRLTQPTVSVAAGTRAATTAIGAVLGDAATSVHAAQAFTTLTPVPRSGHPAALAYFGELDAVQAHASLTAGVWARDAAPASVSSLPVTLPAAAARALGLGVGSSFAVRVGDKAKTARVVGLYRAKKPAGEYWAGDPLRGAGNNDAYLSPDTPAAPPVNAFGPLIVAPGALAAAGIPVQSLDIRYVPDYGRATPGQLASLIDRLDGADSAVPARMGNIAAQVSYSTSGDATYPIRQIASNLIVTRSTVVVVSLLLLMLAVAALGQTARLFNDARDGERQLMRARGASRRQIFALAALEAVLVGAVTAGVSPLLARLVYRLVATQPAMLAAGMPRDAGLPPLAFATAAAVSLLFVAVLLAPLLARSDTFAEGEQKKVRQKRASGFMRSGLDVGLVILAGVVYWQLQSYRSPVGGAASLSVDPVLAIAPAIVLLAASLVCVRLIPLVSRLAEWIGARSRGAVFSLAAWEVGRRSQRATAAVLLLTIALAVGTFSQSFLATWQQSQLDQAAFAVGAPVRVPADPATTSAQGSLLASGARGKPQPVIHRTATVAGSQADLTNANTLDGTNAVVLGLTAQARGMIQRGRLAEEGGARIAELTKTRSTSATGIPLPGDVRGVSATVQVGHRNAQLPGVSAELHAIIGDANGLITTIDLGPVLIDGRSHDVSGLLPVPASGSGPASPLRFLGIQSFIFVSNAAAYRGGSVDTMADILVANLAVQHPLASKSKGDYSTVEAQMDARSRWFAGVSVQGRPQPTTGVSPKGWQLNLRVPVPADVAERPVTYALTAWQPVNGIPAVMSASLAASLSLKKGDQLTLVFPAALVSIQLAGTVPLVPGSSDAGQLTSDTVSGANSSQAGAVIVDQVALERALAQAGVSGAMVDEWWVDVPAGRGQAYLDAHPAANGTSPARSGEVLGLQMQQNPLRVATEAALWIAILAAALLAAVGFAVHAAATLRSRRVEFAELRAIGLSRRGLVAVVGSESLLLCLLGVVFGIGVGVLLSWLGGPLVAVSPDGTPPVPSVVVTFPWPGIVLMAALMAAVLACIVLLVARVQRGARPADVLRGANEL